MRLEHPYDNLTGGQWLRGNLHAHTTASDGSRPMQEVIDDYAARGYQFLMISDHDIHTGPEQYARVDVRGMTLIPGNEITANGPHMLHVNAPCRVEPHAVRQRAITEAVSAGGFIILNHPNWQATFDHCPLALMKQWTGFTGIEIFNGVVDRLEGSPYAVNKWDQLLSSGVRAWGFANDDSHAPEGDCGLGWNCVYAADRSVDAIVRALQAGRFYASTGVTIREIEVTGSQIRIATENADRIVALQQHGQRIGRVDAKEIEIDVPDTAAYVRFTCWGPGESFAWTQPFFVVK